MPTGPDPHLENCPDFERDEDYSSIIEALITAGKTQEEANALQVGVWQRKHNRRIQDWDQQVAAEEEADRARVQAQQEQEDEARRLAEAQQEADKKEREKKIPRWGTLVPNQVLTRTQTADVPSATFEKLCRRAYVPLYDFTREGRSESRATLFSNERSITFDEADDGRLVISPHHLA